MGSCCEMGLDGVWVWFFFTKQFIVPFSFSGWCLVLLLSSHLSLSSSILVTLPMVGNVLGFVQWMIVLSPTQFTPLLRVVPAKLVEGFGWILLSFKSPVCPGFILVESFVFLPLLQ